MNDCLFKHNSGDGYEYTPFPATTTPLRVNKPIQITNVCVLVNTIQKEMEMEWTCHLSHHYPFRDQQAYTIINVCLSVNGIQKEMDMVKTPLSTTTTL